MRNVIVSPEFACLASGKIEPCRSVEHVMVSLSNHRHPRYHELRALGGKLLLTFTGVALLLSGKSTLWAYIYFFAPIFFRVVKPTGK